MIRTPQEEANSERCRRIRELLLTETFEPNINVLRVFLHVDRAIHTLIMYADDLMRAEVAEARLREHTQYQGVNKPAMTPTMPPGQVFDKTEVYDSRVPRYKSSVATEQTENGSQTTYHTSRRPDPMMVAGNTAYIGVKPVSDDELDDKLQTLLEDNSSNDKVWSMQELYLMLTNTNVLPYDRVAELYPDHPIRMRVSESFVRLRQSGSLRSLGHPPLRAPEV